MTWMQITSMLIFPVGGLALGLVVYYLTGRKQNHPAE